MWKRIEDELPPQHQHVLCFGKNRYHSGNMAVLFWADTIGEKPYWQATGIGGYEWETELEPTHWMPLPATPG